jgi:hypothetical protein
VADVCAVVAARGRFNHEGSCGIDIAVLQDSDRMYCIRSFAMSDLGLVIGNCRFWLAERGRSTPSATRAEGFDHLLELEIYFRHESVASAART